MHCFVPTASRMRTASKRTARSLLASSPTAGVSAHPPMALRHLLATSRSPPCGTRLAIASAAFRSLYFDSASIALCRWTVLEWVILAEILKRIILERIALEWVALQGIVLERI